MELYLLRQLAAFRAYKTLSRTAEKLFVTQPALSRSMKKIEEEFGVPLFIREKSKITLNEAGLAAADHAERILKAVDDMFAHVRNKTAIEHTITVGSYSAWATMELVPLLRAAFPDKMIATEASGDADMLQSLTSQAYQLLVSTDPPAGDLFASQRFCSARLCACLPAGHPLAERASLGGKELDGENFLVFAGAMKNWGAIIKAIVPNSRLYPIEDMGDTQAIAESSNMPCISTDLAVRVNGGLWKNRVMIPFADPDSVKTWYVTCLAAHRDAFAPLFTALRERYGD